MAAVSCVQEEAPVTIQQEENNEAAVFTASFSENATKAILNQDYSVAWEAADQVGVFAAAATPHLYVAELMDEAGKKASLSTEETVGSADTYYAIYPYDADATIADGVITTELPAVQTAVKDDFAHHLAVSSTDNYTFKFKNVCGLVKVTVNTSDVVSVVLEGRNNEVVAGGVKVAVGNEPTWVADGAKGSKTVTLKAEADGVLAKGTYYFAVLPQTFENGFTVTSNKKAGEPVVRTVSSKVTVKRAKIVTGNANGIAGKGTEAEPYIIMTAQDMCDMRTLAKTESTTWFKLGADIDMSSVTEWTPVNFDQSYTRQIHFDGAKVADPQSKDDCYTISNFAPESFVDEAKKSANYPSIFGVLYGSCKNLNIINADVNVNKNSVGILGGFVGTTGKPAEVENVHIDANITGGDNLGAFGGQSLEATYKNCSADVEIEASGKECGGFIGLSKGNVNIEGCACKVKMRFVKSDFGGLVGKTLYAIEITNSNTDIEFYSSTSTRPRAGGLVGWVNGTDSKFEECTSKGIIYDEYETTSAHVLSCGGLFGYLGSSTKAVINSCSSSVAIETTYGTSIGGVVGIHGKGTIEISNTTTTGSISGVTNLGGIAGLIEGAVSAVSIKGSMSSSHISGTSHYCGGMIGWLQCPTLVTIEDCHTTGNVISSGGSSIGGFIGAACASDGKSAAGGVSFKDCSSKSIVSGSSNVGGFVGHRRGGGDLINCYHVEGKITGKSTSCAGLVGHFRDGGKIEGCYTEGEIVGGTYVGGLVGSITDGEATIKDSYHKNGNITASKSTANDVYVAGIVGSSYATEYVNCYAECNIETTGKYAGGIVGWQRVGSSFDRCHFSGDIGVANFHVGGIVGRANGVTTISNCWASGNYSSTGNWKGGIIAYCDSNVILKDSYSICNLSGGVNVGGVMGECIKALTADSCIAWGTATASDASVGATVFAAGDGSSINNCYYNSAFTPVAGATGQHGTAAPAGATISSLANSLGWSTDIWDLTGDTPKLK